MKYECSLFIPSLAPPNIYVFTKKAKPAGNVHLTCMVTGFYPKDVIIHFKKNGVQLTEDDGVLSTGARPNNDDTYQIRISVQIPEADKDMYECSVSHAMLKEPIVEKWGKVILVFNILLYIFNKPVISMVSNYGENQLVKCLSLL